MTKDEEFFFKNAAWSYDPQKETPDEGRLRCARALVTAELAARDADLTFHWQDDWLIPSHVDEYDSYDEEPATCEFCWVEDQYGYTLASLGCIDDATPAYRRVIEAELAEEALYQLAHGAVQR